MLRRSTLIILAVFILALSATIYFERTKPDKEAEPTPTEARPLLFSFTSQITGLRLEEKDAGYMEVKRDAEGIWELIHPETDKADIEKIESVVNQVLSLRVVSTMGESFSLEEAGLTAPAYRMVILLEGEGPVHVNVGKETPTGSGYYVQVGDRGVFVVSTYSLDAILKLVKEPPIQPTPTPELDEQETAIPGSEEITTPNP